MSEKNGTLGDYIRNWRVHILHEGLRTFCNKNSLNSGTWSRIERNLRNPPVFDELARMLRIRPGTDEWRKLERLYANHVVLDEVKDVDGLMPAAVRLSEAAREQLKEELRRG
jgi:hypothetical protein